MTNTSHSAEISRVLNDLRSRIRRYVLWEGLAIVVLFLGAVFWGLYLADELRLRFASWSFRSGFDDCWQWRASPGSPGCY